MPDLCIVVPVYNEYGSLGVFLSEWLPELQRAQLTFKMLFIDAGSTDGSQELLTEYARKHSEITLVVREKLPYGPSCHLGYEMALATGADWMLLIDSDGQCDCQYFLKLWALRSASKCVQAFRYRREDGLNRLLVSRALSIFVLLLSGRYIKDLNVPYRLIHRRVLAQVLHVMPADFEFTNVLLSYLCDRFFGMIWVPIVFRKRTAGCAKINAQKMMAGAIRFVPAFSAIRSSLNGKTQLDNPDLDSI